MPSAKAAGPGGPIVQPAPSQLAPSSLPQAHARLALTRIRLSEPGLYEIYRNEHELAMTEVSGATQADLALINGDTATAAALYSREIADRPESPTAWAGLALAKRDKALIERPELVSAVYRRIHADNGTASPADLARWLS